MKYKVILLTLSALLQVSSKLSSQTVLSGVYEASYTLTAALSPYLVEDSAVFKGNLNIEPGVIVTFKHYQNPAEKSYMHIAGTWNVTTNSISDVVLFTSERDNQPFDLNGDSTASLPAAGDWGYVYFDPENMDVSSIMSVHFRYGGGRKFGYESDPQLHPMVVVSDYNDTDRFYSRVAFSDCRFENSAGVGIMTGMAVLNGVQISKCAYGVRMLTSDTYILNSIIRDNRKYPIVLIDPLIKRDDTDDYNSIIEHFAENEIYNNGLDVIALEGDIRCAYDLNTGDPLIPTLLQNFQLPYLITGDLVIDSLQFNIQAGTLVKFLPEAYTGKPLNIYLIRSASLKTLGTENEKVIFTSLHDYKYDKFPPPDQDLKPVAGDWGIISGKNPEINYTLFKYGGKYVNGSSGIAVADSSAVIHITGADPGKCTISSSIFANLYYSGIFVSDSAISGGQTFIHNNSFILDQDNYGVITPDQVLQPDSLVHGTNNYWNGKLGPYHADLNSSGNGCKVDDYIDFSDFQTSSDDALELSTSVIRGVISNDEGEVLNNALIKLDSKNPKTSYTDYLGRFYLSDVKAGDGYKLEVMAKANHSMVMEPLNIPPDTSMNFNIELVKYTIDYGIDTTSFNINPEISTISVGGTAHRYYRIIDVISREPVYGVEVIVPNVDTFYSNSKGIVDIAIPSEKAGDAFSSKSFYIQRVGIETLDFPENSRIYFDVQVEPYSYHKIWTGSTYFTVGISGFEATKLKGAALDLHIKNNGTGEYADSIRFARQTKTGFGYNLGAAAKVSAGPVEAGAEAGIGINLNQILEDDFKFDYPNANGRVALSKFIVLADGALPYMDSPLIRYFTVALEKRMSEIEAAAISNSVGLNLHGYASANAGVDLNLLEGDKGTIGAELKGSASASGDITYMGRMFAHKEPSADQYPLNLSFDYSAEIELGASAGIGFDLEKLFSGDENNDSNESGPEVKKVNSNLPFPVPDEDFAFDLASVNASGGIKYGLHFGTTRFVSSPYCRIGFMYGYKYSYGAKAVFVGENSNSQNREFRYSFDFYDDKMVEMVMDATDLAKSMLSPENLIELKISDLTSGEIFNSPMNSIAYQQSRNSFTIAPVPYQKTITDKVGEGGFNIVIDVGAAVVRAKFGAGFKYAESNKYPKESGVFYKWNLYPFESYDFLAENETYKARPIIQDIVDLSASYLVNEIKQNLVPPIFRKVRIWPFNKKAGASQIPIGPGSRTSHIYFSDSSTIAAIDGIDSLNVVYWDWYGTGDDNVSSKKAVSAEKLALFEYVKRSAEAVHKLDYGIGGFYQFEPYNTSVGDHEAFVVINYFDDELTVMQSDSSIITINENDLRMYKEDKEKNRWVYIGGNVDAMNNTVKARIDTFGTFTLAPFTPSGTLDLAADPDTIKLELAHTTTITSDQIFYNTEEIVADGELFTVLASRGSFQGTDADTLGSGFQVAASGGIIQVIYEADSIAGGVTILAESIKGDSEGQIEIFVTDTMAPATSYLAGIVMEEEDVHLWWESNEEPDIVKYLVLYDTLSGGPYHGVASVFGEPSPVDAGLDSTINISGLMQGKTYYFTVISVDRSGNMSPYSNELSIYTEFNHQPVFYHKIIHIDPDLPKGFVIDTLQAVDQDVSQKLTFYMADTTTENAFALDPETGILTVDNEVRLNYSVTRKDTFLLRVGVKDDAIISSFDEGLVMIVLNIATGVPEHLSGQNSLLDLYPNPAQEFITLKLGDAELSKNLELNIYTLEGKNCYRLVMDNINQSELKIPIQSLENGYYNIVLKTETGIRNGRFVIIK